MDKIDQWHPLTWLSHMADCQAFGLWAGGHHLTNVALQAAAAVLLFLALREMTGKLWRSAFVAAVFAIHPLRVESVAWIAERKDVLSGVFFMLTLWAYARYARQPSRWRCAAVALLYGLGLLCKNTLVTLPFVLLLLDWWPLHRVKLDGAGGAKLGALFGGLVKEKIPLFLISAGSCVLTVLAPEKVSGSARIPFLGRARKRRGFLWHLPLADGFSGGIGHPLSLSAKWPAVLEGCRWPWSCWPRFPSVCWLAGKSAPTCWRDGSGIWECWFRRLGLFKYRTMPMRIVTPICRESGWSWRGHGRWRIGARAGNIVGRYWES